MAHRRQHPMPGNVLVHIANMRGYDDPALPVDPDRPVEVRTETDDVDAAVVVTSELAERRGWHRPVLDLDMPVTLVASSTPGHHHLYVDRAMPWDTYLHLLRCLAEVGLLQAGHLRASEQRGHTAVRVPWMRKGDPAPPLDGQVAQ